MQAHAVNRPRWKDPTSLAEVNQMLHAAGLPAITPRQLEAARAQGERPMLVKALNLASTNDNAKRYLERVFGMIHVPPSGGGDSGKTASPAEREPGLHVYGGKAALCFEADSTRAGEPTVSLDAASACGTRKYDWSTKVRVQLTREELPVVASVLLGLLPRCEYSNHGADNSKGFSLEHQSDKVFVRVFAKDQGVKAVPVPLAEAFYVAALFLRQLSRATGLSAQEIPALLRLTAGRAGSNR